MQYLSVALPLAVFASGALAIPGSWPAPANSSDACAAAVTGSAALGDASLRKGHCTSFLATTVTPPAITVTETITGISGKNGWKRASVTVCPNAVPNYASACDEKGYTSACSVYGITDIITTTLAPTTTTKTVYVAPTGGASCPSAAATVTVTVTTTVGGSTSVVGGTTTVKGASSTAAPASTTTSASSSKCVVDDAKATALVNGFKDLLEHTSYPGNAAQHIPAGQGYDFAVSAATLSPDFVDISDSINFMAGFPLGSITFPNKTAFDYGQGLNQPEVNVTTLNIWHDCGSITWRYRLSPNPLAYPVTGLNYMIVGDDGLLIKNYAEFDNGAWLQSFGQQCAISNVSVVQGPPALKARAILH